MESKGAHKAGVAKVIPPKEWCPVRRYNMKRIGEINIETPVSQTVTGQQGLFQLFNVQKKPMKVKDFKELAEGPRYKPPDGDSDKIERKFWKNITFNPAIYGADIPGSIYDKGVKYWNINHLNTILDTLNTDSKVKILGVNTAYLYFGMWKTTFPWHTEDMDLYSINYLHFGAPKSWYAVPPEHGKRLETLAKGFFSGSFQDCSEFMRHKMTMISPHVLRKFSIPVNKITQYEGEFMITFPFGYHSGYNHGFNCAESTNFASHRWIEFGKKAKHCECIGDSVKIDMDIFIQKYQPDEWKILQQERRQEKQVDSHNKRKTARANYSSDSKDTEESEVESSEVDSDDTEDESDDDDVDVENEVEIKDESDQESTEEEVDDTNNEASNGVKETTKKSTIPKKSSKKISNAKRRSLRQRKLQRSKRHPIHRKRKTSVEETIEEEEEEESERKTNTQHNKGSSPLAFVLDDVWSHTDPAKSKENLLNKILSETETKCSICVYFSQSDAEYLHTGTTVKPEQNKRRSLSALKVGKRLVTELCFADDHSEETAMETAFNLMFGEEKEEELHLLICASCHLAVHSTCYGVPVHERSTKWFCDKCQHLKQQKPSMVKTNTELLKTEEANTDSIKTIESETEEEEIIDTEEESVDIELENASVNDIKCCLCCIRGGALKQTTEGTWCHVVCAIALPEVTFENKKLRGPINATKLNPARKKLNCVYCSENVKFNQDRGACVQCKCGKCASPFHVTCAFHHGIPLYFGDWPVLIETLCPKHIKRKTQQNEKRVLPEVATNDVVLAKHKNGRYYKGRVLEVTQTLFYKVVFEDKSFCFDLPPDDIQGIDARTNVVRNGELVQILWPDSITYRAEVTGHWYEAICQVRFEDSSILNVKRSDLYLQDEEIPKKIKTKLSYASETANKLYLPDSLRNRPKRPRVGTRKCASAHKKL